MCNKVLAAEDSELCISAISKSGSREAKSSAGLPLTSDFSGIITVFACAIECGVSRPRQKCFVEFVGQEQTPSLPSQTG